MDHYSYEVMAKEKVNNLIEEGMRSQAVYKAGASRRPNYRLSKLILVTLGIIGILGLLVR